MDELRLLQRSKEYLDALAQGMDPIQGRAVPQDSVLSQDRLRMCFQYVSGVLQRELDRLGAQEEPASAPAAREEPSAPAEEPEGAAMACAARTAAEAMHLPPRRNTSWVTQALQMWLCQEGLLSRGEREDGRTEYIPTRRGEEIGLILCTSERGYRYPLFRPDALRYIAEHAEDIRNLEMAQWDPLLACLTPEWMRRVRVLEETASATKCVQAILAQLPADLPRTLNVQKVNTWLIKQGILEERFHNTKRRLVPTESGESLGFLPGQRGGQRPSGVKGWTSQAQQFVVDNLPALVQDLRSGEAFQMVPADFAVTEEMRTQLLASRKDLIYWRRLEEWLNAVLVPYTGFQLPEGLIRKYLLEKGLLVLETLPDQRTVKRAAPAGEAVGLRSMDGKYTAEAYTMQGQAYVLDHLEEILDFYCKK